MGKITELSQTAEMMSSTNYQERFLAEYHQLRIRYLKLKEMLENWDKGMLTFEPTCTRATYNFQIRAMGDYLAVLEIRAQLEGIEI